MRSTAACGLLVIVVMLLIWVTWLTLTARTYFALDR